MIIEFIGLLETFRRQNIALNMWKIVKKKKKCLYVAQEAVAPLLLQSQEGDQECWKCEIVLQIRRSADKVPSAVGTCLAGGGEFSSPKNFFFLNISVASIFLGQYMNIFRATRRAFIFSVGCLWHSTVKIRFGCTQNCKASQ